MTEVIDPFAAQSGVVDYGTFTFTAARHILADLCEHAVVAVGARESAQRPDLGCFQMRLAGAAGEPIYLQVTATDLERTVVATTGAVSYEGEAWPDQAYIPARRLLAILREIPQGDVTITVSGNKAVVTAAAGSTGWELRLPAASAYPEFPVLSTFGFQPYPRPKLLDALRAVRHAACRDGSLVNLTQVAITDTGGETQTVATAADGVRMARAALPGFPQAFCIPVSVLDDLVKLLSSSPVPEAAAGQTKSLIGFRVGHVVLAAVKRTAPFPDVDGQLLKKTHGNSEVLEVDRESLAGAVRRVRINADTQSAAIALSLASDALTVAGQDGDNSAAEKLPATWTGEPGRLVVVSHVALSEALSAHPAAVCKFRLGTDVGKKRSLVHLAADGVTQVLTQLPPALAGF